MLLYEQIRICNMAQNFEEILTSMLEQWDENPDQDVNALIEKECEKMGVSEDGKALLSETNEYIESFAANMASLQAAKEKGVSRRQWLLTELDRVLEGRDEAEKVKIVSAISDTTEKVNEETLTKEEED